MTVGSVTGNLLGEVVNNMKMKTKGKLKDRKCYIYSAVSIVHGCVIVMNVHVSALSVFDIIIMGLIECAL